MPMYQARQDVVASDIGGHWALLDLETSMYYTLNASGAQIWDAIQSPASLDTLVTTITKAFSVSQDACRPDVEALINDLVSAGLATITSYHSNEET